MLTKRRRYCYHCTFQADFVPLQRRNTLPEQVLGVLRSSLDTADVQLLELNGDIGSLKDRFNRFGNLATNTVTYNAEKYSINPSIIILPKLFQSEGKWKKAIHTGNQSNGIFSAVFRRLGDVGSQRRSH